MHWIVCGVSFDRSSSSRNASACLFSWNSSTRSKPSPSHTVRSGLLLRGSMMIPIFFIIFIIIIVIIVSRYDSIPVQSLQLVPIRFLDRFQLFQVGFIAALGFVRRLFPNHSIFVHLHDRPQRLLLVLRFVHWMQLKQLLDRAAPQRSRLLIDLARVKRL